MFATKIKLLYYIKLSQSIIGVNVLAHILHKLKPQLLQKESYMGSVKYFFFLRAKIVHAQHDIYHRGPAAELHHRSLGIIAVGNAVDTDAIGSATHNVRRYLRLWALWWAQAIGNRHKIWLAMACNRIRVPLPRLPSYVPLYNLRSKL